MREFAKVFFIVLWTIVLAFGIDFAVNALRVLGMFFQSLM